ncbi:MAG TPA: hypothetical protein VGD67_26255, partial [Pseudonocardiaceae bacterium]
GFVLFRIGRLRWGAADSRALAVELTHRVRDELVLAGAPEGLRVEQDEPQATHVPAGHTSRTLLPHHDGQHCSYLTPSTHDDPDWRPQWREFGDSGYTTTPVHKAYHGVFIADPGDGLSVTTYYDWLDVLHTVYSERTGAPAGTREVARWLGTNLRAAVARRPLHGNPYPGLGGMLGLTGDVWHGVSLHHAEADLPADVRAAYPDTGPLAAACPCGDCVGEAARLHCHQVLLATGRRWRDFRRRWEVLVPGERFDLVFGHNLTMLHGGLAGSAGRVIEPLCLVVDDPAGPRYESWLAASWRRHRSADG